MSKSPVHTEQKIMSADTEKNLEEKQAKCMSKCRIMKNLLITCLGFFFLFCAFQSHATLQTTINRQGSMSQSVVYAAFAVSSLLFPKLLISKLGCKYTLFLSIVTYIPFMVSNYYRDFLSQLLTSILLGLGGATLWSSACTYINEISGLYSSQSDEPVDVITTRFFGIFFMIFQNSQIWGNLVSFFVLKSIDSVSTDNAATTASVNTNEVCGIDFCGEINQQLGLMTDERRFILITVYLGFTILAALIIFLFLDRIQRNDSDEGSSIICSKLAATLKHLRKPNQILIIPITIFMGMEQAFILSDYSQPCGALVNRLVEAEYEQFISAPIIILRFCFFWGYIACAWGIKNVSLVFICYGVINAAASFLVGRFSKYVPRLIILLTGAAGNVAACAIMFLWIPNSTSIIYYFVTIGLWGMSDAVWQTIINSMYGILFRKDEEAAYGNLRLWEAIGFFIPYFCNRRLCMPAKLYIVLGVLATGLLGCIIVEISIFIKSRFCSVATINECNKK